MSLFVPSSGPSGKPELPNSRAPRDSGEVGVKLLPWKGAHTKDTKDTTFLPLCSGSLWSWKVFLFCSGGLWPSKTGAHTKDTEDTTFFFLL
jgi:hypothetical protein